MLDLVPSTLRHYVVFLFRATEDLDPVMGSDPFFALNIRHSCSAVKSVKIYSSAFAHLIIVKPSYCNAATGEPFSF